MTPENRLAELGLTLPNPPAAAGSYVPTVRTGNLLYCAGTICMVGGQMTHVGQVGKEQTVQTANKAAEVCALNTLANIKAAVGSLERVSRIVFVSGFVNAVDGFADHFHVGHFLKEQPQPRPYDAVIVRDQNLHHSKPPYLPAWEAGSPPERRVRGWR